MSKYMPKTTEWMRQNNWGAEAQQLVTADLASCESSLAEAERVVERLRAKYEPIETIICERCKRTMKQCSNGTHYCICWTPEADLC